MFVYLILYHVMDLAPLKSMAVYAGVQVFWSMFVLMLTLPPAIMVREIVLRKYCKICKKRR